MTGWAITLVSGEQLDDLHHANGGLVGLALHFSAAESSGAEVDIDFPQPPDAMVELAEPDVSLGSWSCCPDEVCSPVDERHR